MAKSRNAVKSGRNTRARLPTGAERRAERAAQRAAEQAELITSATPPSSAEPSPPLEQERKCPTMQEVPPAPPAPPCNASGDGSPEGEDADKARPSSSSHTSDTTCVTSWRAGSRGSIGDLSSSGGSLLDKLKEGEAQEGEQAGQQGEDMPQSDVQADKATTHGPPSSSPSVTTTQEEEQQHASTGMDPSADATKDAEPPLALLPPVSTAPEAQDRAMPKVEEGEQLVEQHNECITPTLDDQRDGHEQVSPKRLSASASSFVPVTLPDGLMTGCVSTGVVSPHYDGTALLHAQMEYEAQHMTDQQAGGYDAQQWPGQYDEQAEQRCFNHAPSADMYPPQQYIDNTQMAVYDQYEQAALEYGHQPQAPQCQAAYPPPQGYFAPPPVVYDNNYGVPMHHLQHEQGFDNMCQQQAYGCPPSTGVNGTMPHPNEALYAHQHQEAMWHYEQQQHQEAMWWQQQQQQQQMWEYHHQQAMMMAQHQNGDYVYDVHSGQWYPAWQYQPYHCQDNHDVYQGMSPCAVAPEAVLPMGVDRTTRRRRRHRGSKGARANRAAVAY